MFISSATITENYTTYWEKVKSTVITGPPAEYVVRGVSAESFQVSLTGQTLSNSRYLVSHYRRSCLLLAWFPVLSTQEGGITFLANTCSTHRERCRRWFIFQTREFRPQLVPFRWGSVVPRKMGSKQTVKHQPVGKVGSLQKDDRKENYSFSP